MKEKRRRRNVMLFHTLSFMHSKLEMQLGDTPFCG